MANKYNVGKGGLKKMWNAEQMREITRKQNSEFRNLLNMFSTQIMRAATREQYDTFFSFRYTHEGWREKQMLEMLDLIKGEFIEKGYQCEIEYSKDNMIRVQIDWSE